MATQKEKERVKKEFLSLWAYGHPNWAYLAGLIDGEGTITVVKEVKGTARPTLVIVNTNKEVLQWVKDNLNQGNLYNKGHEKEGWKDRWAWSSRGKHIKPILENILPFLKIKHQQAKLVLEFIELRDFYAYKIKGFAPEELEIVRQIYNLNKGRRNVEWLKL